MQFAVIADLGFKFTNFSGALQTHIRTLIGDVSPGLQFHPVCEYAMIFPPGFATPGKRMNTGDHPGAIPSWGCNTQ
jgi:hypothetical protein